MIRNPCSVVRGTGVNCCYGLRTKDYGSRTTGTPFFFGVQAVQRRDFCCDTNRLRLLLDDELPTPAQVELVGHLDDCQECQRALEELAAEKPWWHELRRLHGLEKRDESTAPPTAEYGRTGSDEQGPLALDFLDPSDDPQHLGRLDRFEVTAHLGRGGFGLVLKAHDPTLNRLVAIKVLAPYFASSGAARKRFAREAKAAATVVHPHVVPIHTVDSWKGLPYLVMSYIPGRALQERLDREGPLELKEILRIGMQTASGLAAAHAQGLVHRDVKPANILLEHDVGPVWLTDFGLARAADDASLTQSGVIAGTPQYMAPEQAQGSTVDHRADLFSLGSTLYAMSTGHAPFRADSAMAVLRRVCEDRPRPIQEINPDIPIWLAAIIDKLLAKAPSNRYQSAAEVADLLEKCLAHVQQPSAHPLPFEIPPCVFQGRGTRRDGAPPGKDVPKRPRWPAAILLLFGLGALAVSPLGPWGTRVPPDETSKPAVPELLRNETAKPVAASPKSFNPEPTATVGNHIHEMKPSPALWPEGDPLEQQIEKIHRYTAAALAELKQPAPPAPEDVIEMLLRKTRQELNALERDLTASPPRKARGGPLVKGEGP
jgi:eukaryotic-like serine/threonine-protein kinase